LISGILLILKKEIEWVQPSTQKSAAGAPTLEHARLLDIAKGIPEAEIHSWTDINRLDIRPNKGVIKVRAENGWEIQLHHQTGEVKQVAYRRTDWIESLHDGSFFHKHATLWVFLPAAAILTLLWITGLYLFLLPYISKAKNKHRRAKRMARLNQTQLNAD